MKPVRILISDKARLRIGSALGDAMQGQAFELVAPATSPDHAPADIHIAYCSRDVTGASTKHDVLPPLEAFYTSLRRSPQLQWLHLHSAGLDRPICTELAERDVRVTASPGANAEVVAQTALAAVLMLARQFPRMLAQQRERRWASLVETGMPADLNGQTALVAGWGPIGQRIAAFLTMLGMKVIVARSSRNPVDDDTETLAFEDVPGHAHRLDWLILACPLTSRTRQWLDARFLASLKTSAYVVNVARGEIIDQPALVEALQARRLAGAYLDVFEHEPLPMTSPLWALDNVIVTPHSAGHSDGNERRVDNLFLQHLNAWAMQRHACA